MKAIPHALRKQTGMQYLLDQMEPASPYGGSHIRRPALYPPHQREALETAWHNTAAAQQGLAENGRQYDALLHLFMQMKDIRGTLTEMHETVLTEVELYEIKRFLMQLEVLVAMHGAFGEGYRDIAFIPQEEALAILDPDGKRAAGFSIEGGTDSPLAQIQAEKRRLELALRDEPEGEERAKLMQARRAIVAEEEAEMLAIRKALTKALRPHAHAMLENIDMIGVLDFTIQKAKLAARWHMCRPSLGGEGLSFRGMENPEIAVALQEKGRRFTPVTVETPVGLTVVTGANMGGKSIALRTLVLNILLCQAGFFACAEHAETMLFDAVYLLGDDRADAAGGLSSFGGEVLEIQRVLDAVQGGAFCFIAMDEPARGTNPREGTALVKALASKLSRLHTVAVIATHYNGVAPHAQRHYQAAALKHIPESLPEGDALAQIAACMDYGLTLVDKDADVPQEALAICRLLGMDAGILAEMEAELQSEGLKQQEP